MLGDPVCGDPPYYDPACRDPACGGSTLGNLAGADGVRSAERAREA